MVTLFSVLGAFTVVFGMLGFLVYCNSRIDAEAERVASFRE